MQSRTVSIVLAVLAVTLVAGGSGAAPVGAQAGRWGAQMDGPRGPFCPRRTVTTIGEAEVRTEPDLVVVELGVQVEQEDAEEAFADASERMQDVLDALGDLDVPEEGIQTRTVGLAPRYEPPIEPGGSMRLVGFVATNTVQVRLEDVDLVGTVIGEAVAAGANLVERISFGVRDPSALRLQALELAYDDAEARARALAERAGVQLGAALTITTQQVSPIGAPVPAAEVAVAVPIQPGQLAISARVQVTFLLEPPLGVEVDADDGDVDVVPARVAAVRARAALAEELGLPPGQIQVASVDEVAWPDGCLGLAEPGEFCPQVVTPGFRVMLQAAGETYEARTDLEAEQVRFAEP